MGRAIRCGHELELPMLRDAFFIEKMTDGEIFWIVSKGKGRCRAKATERRKKVLELREPGALFCQEGRGEKRRAKVRRTRKPRLPSEPSLTKKPEHRR